jgi:uncharacterized protein YkwD
MTSLSRAPRHALRLGTLLAAPPVLGTLAVLPSASPAGAATASADLAAALPATATATAPAAVSTLAPGSVSVGVALNQPIVGGVASGPGFLLVARDGGIFSVGGASFLGSMGGRHLNQPIVGVAATPTGRGYWMVASDGGVFSFGDAPFLGSMGGRRLTSPVVGMAPSPTGRGYWLVAADGGVFSFGDAPFLGSMGGHRLASQVVGMAAAPGGRGYWLAGADGGVFSFGSAPFLGAATGHTAFPVSGITTAGSGYYLSATDGGVFSFGASFQGAPVGAGQGAVVGIASAAGSYRLFTNTGVVLGPNDGGVVRASSAASLATGVVSGINADRAAHGLAAVSVDGSLNSLASDWARHCSATNTMVHRDLASLITQPGWSVYSLLGETIYWGESTVASPSSVMNGWQASPTHQAVITDGRFNVVGVGVYVAGGKTWVVADFGRK